MDAIRREQIRMLVRILDPIAEEVRRVSLQEEDNFSNRPEPSKETEAGQTSKEASEYLDAAHAALSNALDNLNLAVGDDGDDVEQGTEAPWPLVSVPPSGR